MATIILVSITLSLSYVVYEGVSGLAPPRQVVFTNQVTQIGGSPSLSEVLVNASSAGTPIAFEAGGASSHSGVLFFDGSRYGTTRQLCLANATTFFSVHTGAGTLIASGNGRTWIDGYWTGSLAVTAGWHEVMITDSSSCSITETDSTSVAYPSADLSTVPLMGAIPSSSFSLYVPTGGAAASFVMVFDGSYDRIA